MSFKEKVKQKIQETKNQLVIMQTSVIDLFENLREELKGDDFYVSWDHSKSISQIYVSAFETNVTVAKLTYREDEKFDFEMLLGEQTAKSKISLSELEYELINTFIPAVYKRFQTRLNPLKSFIVCDITMETIGEICGYVYDLGSSGEKSEMLQKLSDKKKVEIVVSNISTVNEHLLEKICFLQEREENKKYMVSDANFSTKENVITVIDVERLIHDLTEEPSYNKSYNIHPAGELKIFQNLEEEVKKKLQEEYKHHNPPVVRWEQVAAEVSASTEETKSEDADTDAKLLD